MSEYTKDDMIVLMPCDERHFFHKDCITEWIKEKDFCPLCKKPITEEALEKQKERHKKK